MAADASIYSLIQAPKMQGPLEQYAQAMTVGNLMGQGKLQDMQLRSAERGEQEGMQIRDLFRRGNVKPEEIDAISPEKGLAYRKSQTESQTAAANLQKVDRENFVGMLDQARRGMQTIRTPEQWTAFRDEQIRRAGMFQTDGIRNAAMQAAQSMPAQFDQNYIRDALVKAEDLFTPKLERVTKADGSIETVDMNPITNPKAGQFKAAPGMTPAELDAKARGWATINKPTWDSERGVYVQPPQMGGSVMSQPGAAVAGQAASAPSGQPMAPGAPGAAVASPAGVPGVVAPANLPPRASDSKLTEAQGNAAAFGMRAAASNKILNELEKAGTTDTGVIKSVVSGAAGLAPFIGDKLDEATGSVMNTMPRVLGGPNENQQKTEQARRDFINAVLRKESGAVISPAEFQNANRQYFPQPGDGPEVIRQKRNNREMAIKALSVQAGPGAKHIGGGGIKFLGFE